MYDNIHKYLIHKRFAMSGLDVYVRSRPLQRPKYSEYVFQDALEAKKHTIFQPGSYLWLNPTTPGLTSGSLVSSPIVTNTLVAIMVLLRVFYTGNDSFFSCDDKLLFPCLTP